MPYHHLLADRTQDMGASAIREILKVVDKPGMISLAGGIPAAEALPTELIRELSDKVLTQYGSRCLQYDATEGFADLLDTLPGFLRNKSVEADTSDIVVFCGSQGVLQALAQILISPGDTIAVESPTYLGALSAFAPYQPKYSVIESDEEGILPDSLESILRSEAVKFVYAVSTYQNPTGKSLSHERRRAIAEILRKYDGLLVEDDPYSDLRYSGEFVMPIYSYAPDHVVYVSTFSKVLAPGLRVGYCVAPDLVRKWLVIAKQGMDLHTSTFSQALATEYLDGGHFESHVAKLVELYRPRLAAMLHALKQSFPEGFTWTRPLGGMFVWVEGPELLDIDELYRRAIAENVAFVPGSYFYVSHGPIGATMRLNFTSRDENTIDQAVTTLGHVAAATTRVTESGAQL